MVYSLRSGLAIAPHFAKIRVDKSDPSLVATLPRRLRGASSTAPRTRSAPAATEGRPAGAARIIGYRSHRCFVDPGVGELGGVGLVKAEADFCN